MLEQSFCNKIEAGCDEAGRGCLAGPVVAAAVILPKDFKNKILNDSKLLSRKKRVEIEKNIKRNAISWAVSSISNSKIDEINILNASFLAMNYAVKKLSTKPELLLIDGNLFRTDNDIEYKCIIKGDQKFMSIAAASIIAKNYRDNIMCNLHAKYPKYNWHKNKGYSTIEHRESIKKYGITNYHRKSFQLIKPQLTLSL